VKFKGKMKKKNKFLWRDCGKKGDKAKRRIEVEVR